MKGMLFISLFSLEYTTSLLKSIDYIFPKINSIKFSITKSTNHLAIFHKCQNIMQYLRSMSPWLPAKMAWSRDLTDYKNLSLYLKPLYQIAVYFGIDVSQFYVSDRLNDWRIVLQRQTNSRSIRTIFWLNLSTMSDKFFFRNFFLITMPRIYWCKINTNLPASATYRVQKYYIVSTEVPASFDRRAGCILSETLLTRQY